MLTGDSWVKPAITARSMCIWGSGRYWIEGPTGEDIRSSWRGQPIHVLVVDALLHPRATNLPAHVQSAYIQSAMKVNVASEGQLSFYCEFFVLYYSMIFA